MVVIAQMSHGGRFSGAQMSSQYSSIWLSSLHVCATAMLSSRCRKNVRILGAMSYGVVFTYRIFLFTRLCSCLFLCLCCAYELSVLVKDAVTFLAQ